jgi:hypothetical protein
MSVRIDNNHWHFISSLKIFNLNATSGLGSKSEDQKKDESKSRELFSSGRISFFKKSYLLSDPVCELNSPGAGAILVSFSSNDEVAELRN